tara:strand:+ start:63 stop:962 length:900 start_codon:yes stop_codon:yes gene_type:complete
MNNLLKEELIGLNGPLSGKTILNYQSVSGGCIHDSWKLLLEDGEELFIKANTPEAFPLLKFEAECLCSLRNFADKEFLVVPQPLAIQKLESFSILLMPWLNLSGTDQSLLGKGLAILHKNSAQYSEGKFGWGSDGFIGSNSQPAGWRSNWGECFVELRLFPQLVLAKSWGLEITSFVKNKAALVQFLNNHNPLPCLVHGDLWSGNAFVQFDGKGVLIDPATWWADREVDIAMSKMFGGYSIGFYKSYEEIWPLEKNIEQRIDVYNFYHLLNHANLFGGTYKEKSISSMQKIEALLEKYF